MTKEDVIEILERFVLGAKPCSQREIVDACASAYRMLKEQPSLPSNLDEAAKECAIREGYLAGLHHETMKRVFKAGAKWDAGQGYVDTQAVINEYEDWGDGFAKLELGILKNDDFFKDWKKQNEIIVQIRKKQ